MNRYVITREVLGGIPYTVSALYNDKNKMIEVLPEAANAKSILGNIYIARVENIVKNLNAAFVKIADGQNCFLSLEDCKNPIFTRKQSKNKPIAAGDELLVQVVREALKTKVPAVTANLSLTGQYAVLTTGNTRLSVSSKLPSQTRAAYKKLLAEQNNVQEYGWIVRTNAASVDTDTLLYEMNLLSMRYAQLLETASHKTCCSLLYRQPPSYLRYLDDLRQAELEEIVTDDLDIFDELCEKYQIPPEARMTTGSVSVPVYTLATGQGFSLRYHSDDMISLSALYNVRSNLNEALQKKVWLKSGAYLIIELTEAMTVIDVNTGKNIAKKDAQDNFLRINEEAALEIARQLRLRNISGIIVVDFINLDAKEAEEQLLESFRDALKKDPVPTQLIDMTRLGLVEITRKKVRKSLRENLPNMQEH
jgi:ribonuclease G